jgi:hypothetical protein
VTDFEGVYFETDKKQSVQGINNKKTEIYNVHLTFAFMKTNFK